MRNKLKNKKSFFSFFNSSKNEPSFLKKINQKGFALLEISKTRRKNKKRESLTGFSLIEVLASISVLLITISVVLTIFFISVQSQRRILASQELLNSVAYVLEYMSRAIRMAKKELNPPVCLSERGLNYELTRGGRGLKFINHRDKCQEFFLVNGRLKERKNGQEQFLTPKGLEIVSWNLYLSGQSQKDNLQPRVTFSFRIKGKGARAELRPEIKVQTTISQRTLDLQR